MYSSIILPSATEDILNAARWYNSKKKDLGKRFTTQVRERVRLLEKHPQSTPIRYANVRTAILKNFPFMIHYEVNENEKLIIVIAIFHTSKNPASWLKK